MMVVVTSPSLTMSAVSSTMYVHYSCTHRRAPFRSRGWVCAFQPGLAANRQGQELGPTQPSLRSPTAIMIICSNSPGKTTSAGLCPAGGASRLVSCCKWMASLLASQLARSRSTSTRAVSHTRTLSGVRPRLCDLRDESARQQKLDFSYMLKASPCRSSHFMLASGGSFFAQAA